MSHHQKRESIHFELGEARVIGAEIASRLVAYGDDERIGDLASLLTDYNYELDIAAERLLVDAVARHIAARGDTGSSVLTYVEGLEYLRELFYRLWNRRERFETQLEALKKSMAVLCATWPAKSADLVVTVVLEHLFQLEGVADYFGDWSHVDVLADAYDSAIELCEMWKRQGIKGEEGAVLDEGDRGRD